MSRQSSVCYIVTTVAIVFLFSSGSAFEVNTTSSGNPVKWFTPSTSYLINMDGGPSNSASAVAAAMQAWSSVPGSAFIFSEMESSSVPCDGSSHSNAICFGPINQQGIIAQNEFWYNSSSGQVLKSAITFNTNYQWSTEGSANAFDVQDIITHELGHTLSLKDLYSAGASAETMYGYSSLGETSKRILSPDDMAGIVYLYPSGAGTPPTPTCTYTISPASLSPEASGGVSSVTISTQNGCAWSASASLPWVVLNGPLSGNGNGKIDLTVSPNADSTARVGNITVASKTVTINQAAQSLPPSISISPASLSFGPVKVNSQSTKYLNVAINGKASVLSVLISGKDANNFAITGTCQATQNGATCRLSIAFKPVSTGSKSVSMAVAVPSTKLSSTVQISGTAL